MKQLSNLNIMKPQGAGKNFARHKFAVAGLLVLVAFILLAILVPWLAKYSYSDQNLAEANLFPGPGHIFGTDSLGRDIFVRIWYGARISLSIGIVAAVIQGTVGVVYGAVAGFAGGRIDNLMMRIVDILYGIPVLLVAILIMVITGSGFLHIVIVFGLLYWLPMARVVRGQILSLREQEFILAARALGADGKNILFRHLLPNMTGPVLVMLAFAVPEAIYLEAFLSLLGLGVSAPTASWGVMVNEALPGLRSYPHQLIFPAAAISITLLSLNLIGDALQEAFDPRRNR